MATKTSGSILNLITAIFIIVLATQNAADKICPNQWSYIYNDKCYSLHLEDFNYEDAIDFCIEKGGSLWSQETKDEVTFLKQLYVKVTTSDYWVGWHKDHDVWRYSSDGSPIQTDHHMKKSSKINDECVLMAGVDTDKTQLKVVSCKWQCYAICEFKGDSCEKKINSGKKCFQFLTNKLNFKNSKSQCQKDGGQLVELRNSIALDFYKTVIKKNKAFESLTETELKRQLTSPVSIWKGQFEDSEMYDDGMCKEYHNWVTSLLPCNASRNFICMYQAIDYVEDNEDIENEILTQPPDDSDDPDDPEQDNNVQNYISVIPIWAIVLMAIMGLAILSLIALIFRNNRVAAGFHQLNQ